MPFKPPEFPDYYQLVPANEISHRRERLQAALIRSDLDGLLILHGIDRYYFSGTLQDGMLWLPASGKPVFWVRRSLARARQESPLEDLRPYPPSAEALRKELSAAITSERTRIGLELDVIPFKVCERLQRSLPDQVNITDASPLIRELRARKSVYEIDCIRRAAAIMDEVMTHAASILRPGITEIELMAELEHEARRRGHLGIVRMRGWNSELFFGHAISGPEGARRGYMDSPTNGLGLSPAFPQGASRETLRPKIPISIDFMVNYEGYLADMTRMFCLGEADPGLIKSHAQLLALNRELVAALRPGREGGAIFDLALKLAADYGFAENFLGHGPDRVSFVGHGLGLEVDEFPFIARGSRLPLTAGMVVALEPKLTIPSSRPKSSSTPSFPAGLITTESTYLITDESTSNLCLTPENINFISG